MVTRSLFVLRSRCTLASSYWATRQCSLGFEAVDREVRRLESNIIRETSLSCAIGQSHDFVSFISNTAHLP